MKGAGKRLATAHLSVRVAVSLLPYCRVAVVVGKHGHTTAERNHLRRRLRELARTILIPRCKNADLLVQALPTAYGIAFRRLYVEITAINSQLENVIMKVS